MTYTRKCDCLRCDHSETRWIGVELRPPRNWFPPYVGIGGNAIRHLPIPGGASAWSLSLRVGLDACSLRCLAEILRDCPEGSTVISLSGYEFPACVLGGCASALANDLVAA